MSYTTPRTWVTGETVTASMMNEQVRDNIAAIWPAFVTSDTVSAGKNMSGSITSTSFVELTNGAINITPTRTSTIFAIFNATLNNPQLITTTYRIQLDDGTEYSEAVHEQGGGYSTTQQTSAIIAIPNQTASTHKINIVAKVSSGGPAVFSNAYCFVICIPEG